MLTKSGKRDGGCGVTISRHRPIKKNTFLLFFRCGSQSVNLEQEKDGGLMKVLPILPFLFYYFIFYSE